ncbi:MAG: alcohol dehydrogenase catalytic domain-containing protein [Ardenticatenaceae bacterium]|nr:alcohol dehydrogenase catalytic domain-containing protein [Ardenticatenaceae bacterium]
MNAIYLENGQLFVRSDYEKPQLQPGLARLAVSLAGICSTDLEIVKGYVPGFQGVLGHEFVAVVEAVGSPADADWIGRRVVGTMNIGCGECATCLSTGPEHCLARRALGVHNWDGVFADYALLPVANLLPVPDNVPDEAAVFTEPLAAALRIREQVRVRPSVRTAVVGPGRLGLLVGLMLALDGTHVTMLGRRESSLALPARLGFTTGLVDGFDDNSFDFVVEVTGNDAGFSHALRLVRSLGTLVLKSTFAGQSTLDLTKLVVAEITVIGSRCGPFAPALRLLAQDAVPVRALIDGEYPLSQGLAAFEHAARSGVRKILLRP